MDLRKPKESWQEEPCRPIQESMGRLDKEIDWAN
jgi:hypothetical protein